MVDYAPLIRPTCFNIQHGLNRGSKCQFFRVIPLTRSLIWPTLGLDCSNYVAHLQAFVLRLQTCDSSYCAQGPREGKFMGSIPKGINVRFYAEFFLHPPN